MYPDQEQLEIRKKNLMKQREALIYEEKKLKANIKLIESELDAIYKIEDLHQLYKSNQIKEEIDYD